MRAGVGACASVESRELALCLLRTLVEVADPSSLAASAPAALAMGARCLANVAASLRPRMQPLLAGLLDAIAHAAPPAAVQPSAELLHSLGQALPEEYRAALPAALAQLSEGLVAARRAVPPRALELLHGALLSPAVLAPQAETCVALCTDLAQVVRAGISVRALERYVPKA